MKRRRLADAVRLQLTQYLPQGAFAFVCRREPSGAIVAWAWPLAAGARGQVGGWPEPAGDTPPDDGLRLVRRVQGFEAQQWVGAELMHSRWFASLPGVDAWLGFARGCGVDPQAHPLPEAVAAATSTRAARGWTAGDTLPKADPWQGWRWQAALLTLSAAAAAGLGMHLQAHDQLRRDTQRLEALRSGREVALQARARYEQTATELEALRALVPRLSQLELYDRVAASGIFAPATADAPPPAASAPPQPGFVAPTPPEPARAQLAEWDYRNGQLKLALELPERELTLLDITRRIENVPGLGAWRVGQDSTGNTLSLTAAVTTTSARAPR